MRSQSFSGGRAHRRWSLRGAVVKALNVADVVLLYLPLLALPMVMALMLAGVWKPPQDPNGLAIFAALAAAGGFVMASASLLIAAADRAPERLKAHEAWNRMVKSMSLALGGWFLGAFAFLMAWLIGRGLEGAFMILPLTASWGIRFVLWMVVVIQRFRTDVE